MPTAAFTLQVGVRGCLPEGRLHFYLRKHYYSKAGSLPAPLSHSPEGGGLYRCGDCPTKQNSRNQNLSPGAVGSLQDREFPASCSPQGKEKLKENSRWGNQLCPQRSSGLWPQKGIDEFPVLG